jgi:hypothetical protein
MNYFFLNKLIQKQKVIKVNVCCDFDKQYNTTQPEQTKKLDVFRLTIGSHNIIYKSREQNANKSRLYYYTNSISFPLAFFSISRSLHTNKTKIYYKYRAVKKLKIYKN